MGISWTLVSGTVHHRAHVTKTSGLKLGTPTSKISERQNAVKQINKRKTDLIVNQLKFNLDLKIVNNNLINLFWKKVEDYEKHCFSKYLSVVRVVDGMCVVALNRNKFSE